MLVVCHLSRGPFFLRLDTLAAFTAAEFGVWLSAPHCLIPQLQSFLNVNFPSAQFATCRFGHRKAPIFLAAMTGFARLAEHSFKRIKPISC